MIQHNSKFYSNYTKIPASNSIKGNLALIDEIGCWFVTQSNDNSKIVNSPRSITPLHGRVCAYQHQGNWYLLKGTGWTFGLKPYLVSPKDDELFFGIYGLDSAKRELAVSSFLCESGVRATIVEGYADISHFFKEKLLYKNGKAVNPCILYTKVRSVYRVADLAYLTPEERMIAVRDICIGENWDYDDYFDNFCHTLTKSVSIMHKANCCNDTLDSGNVTLAGEITDFEWVTVPNVDPLFGKWDENLEGRRLKEIIYLYEVCLQLSVYLNINDGISRIKHSIEIEYQKWNPENSQITDCVTIP